MKKWKIQILNIDKILSLLKSRKKNKGNSKKCKLIYKEKFLKKIAVYTLIINFEVVFLEFNSMYVEICSPKLKKNSESINKFINL